MSFDSENEYELNQNYTITYFPIIALRSGPYRVRANSYRGEWQISNANDSGGSYRQFCSFESKVVNTSYSVTNSQQETNKWINSTQMYETSKSLLENI